MTDEVLSNCVNCEAKLPPGGKFCPECGGRITRFEEPAEETLGDKLLLLGDKPASSSKALRNTLLTSGFGLVTILSLIVLTTFDSVTEKNDAVESVTQTQSQAPSAANEGIGLEEDQSTSDTQSQSVSEWKIFSDTEAVDFWSYQLGKRFTQEDVFVRLLFPSISDQVRIFSIPYIQLLLWPTTEWFELEEEALNQDIYQAGDRSNWVACSNVVIVFPNSRYDEFAKINDVFCD